MLNVKFVLSLGIPCKRGLAPSELFDPYTPNKAMSVGKTSHLHNLTGRILRNNCSLSAPAPRLIQVILPWALDGLTMLSVSMSLPPGRSGTLLVRPAVRPLSDEPTPPHPHS